MTLLRQYIMTVNNKMPHLRFKTLFNLLYLKLMWCACSCTLYCHALVITQLQSYLTFAAFPEHLTLEICPECRNTPHSLCKNKKKHSGSTFFSLALSVVAGEMVQSVFLISLARAHTHSSDQPDKSFGSFWLELNCCWVYVFFNV